MNKAIGMLAVLLVLAAGLSATSGAVFLNDQQTHAWFVSDGNGCAHYVGPAVDGYTTSGYVPYIPTLDYGQPQTSSNIYSIGGGVFN